MNYCGFIADLIIFIGLEFDRLTLVTNDNRPRFLKFILFFLVEIIANILDNHVVFVNIIAIFFARTFFGIRRYHKLPIS